MLPMTLQAVLEKSEIPPLPDRYRRLAAAEQEALAELLRQDDGVATLLLALAGSPLFGPAPVADVAAALERVGGFEPARDLLLGALVVRLLGDVLPEIVSTDAFWRHNVACGVVARVIAAQRGEVNPERFFLSGLLHDLGSLFLYRHVPERTLIQLLHARDVSTPLYALERELLGFDHAALSGAVVAAWQLPEAVTAAVTHHHSPRSDSASHVEEAVVHLADLIAVALEFGSRGEYCVPPLAPHAWESVDLPVSALADIIAEVDRQLPAACRIYLEDNPVAAHEP